jgi:RHS repeat-associated protein
LTTDHLSSPRVITDADGKVKSRKDYTAFGETTSTVQRTANLGYESPNVRQGYTGYEKDVESGLEFAQARYYSATHGRFTSVDPLMASASIKNPQTFNRYSYVLNSPYKYTDPLGLIAGKPTPYKSSGSSLTDRVLNGTATKNDLMLMQFHVANGTALGYSYLNAVQSRQSSSASDTSSGSAAEHTQSAHANTSPVPPPEDPVLYYVWVTDTKDTTDPNDEANINLINADAINNFTKALQEIKDAGIKLVFADVFRDSEMQKRRRKKFEQGGPKAAKAGTSCHEAGMCFDVYILNKDEKTRSDPNKTVVNIFKKYGFTRTVSDEAWHFEMSGTTSEKINEAQKYYKELKQTIYIP